MTGIYITKGMSVGISKFELRMDESGKLDHQLELSVSYDACIAWARIAVGHQKLAADLMERRRSEWAKVPVDEIARGSALEDEFQASMQTIVASAICVDALYDHMVPHASIPPETRMIWAKEGMARYKQVAEIFRTAFNLQGETFQSIRNFLKILYSLRDSAVHPSSKPHQPTQHPELHVAMDWRLASFRGDTADLIACNTLAIIWDLCHQREYRSKILAEFVANFAKRFEELLPDGRPVSQNAEVNISLGPISKQRG